MAGKILGRFIGIVFLVCAVYFAVAGVSIYSQQKVSAEWRISMAAVTEVSTRRESSGGGRHNRSIIVYDISYQYNVNWDSYTGKIIGSRTSKAVGDRFDVKYDPEYPEHSTAILEPQTDALLSNLLGSCAFAAIGLLASGIFSWFKKRISSGRRKGSEIPPA